MTSRRGASAPRAVVGPVPAGRDPDTYDRLRRRVLWSMPSGLYVVGTRAGSRRNLMTTSWVTQVATEPKLVGIGVEARSVSHALIDGGGVFSVSLLPRARRALVRRFAKPVAEASFDEGTGAGTMEGEPVRTAVTGAPILDAAAAWLDCEVRHTLALGSHTWFVGEVVDCGEELRAGDLPPTDGGAAPADGDAGGVLRMEDTRMTYGG